MPINLSMAIMSAAEFVLWAMLCILFWRKELQRRFPAMRMYLFLRLCSQPVLLLLLWGQARHWLQDHCFAFYFYTYWLVYLASAIMLYFVSLEVFRSALSGFMGLLKLGTVAFRWAAIVSLIVSLTNTSFSSKSFMILVDFSQSLMRSVSILELCLLAFLCLCLNALRISVRSVSFGIALGFGLMSAGDFVVGSMIVRNIALTAPLQYVSELMTLLVLSVWIVYTVIPEPESNPFVVPANSTIYRWNEIASVLGHTGTRVAVQQPSTGFFLSDVERVVEKVLARNLPGNEIK